MELYPLFSGLRILGCVGSELAGPGYSLAVKIFHFLTNIFYLIYMFFIEEFDISYRQHIKKQRHYFVNKGASSQGYGFSSGHVWM